MADTTTAAVGPASPPARSLALLAALLAACAASRPSLPPEPAPRPEPLPGRLPGDLHPGPVPPEPPPGLLARLPGSTRARLVETAGRWIARTGAFRARGRRFPPDCSGFVEAVYESQGIPIRDAFALRPRDEGSAAAALRRVLSDKLGVLYGSEREPLPGDLVFFEETYDRNRNGKVDDGVTHVGLVEGVRADGTVVFLHRSGKGVARGRLHPRDASSPRGPGGDARNTPLRAPRRGDPRARALAGELFAGFGRIDPARVAAALDGNERLDLAALGYEEGPPLAELPAGVLGAGR